jgi:hypothetical protein
MKKMLFLAMSCAMFFGMPMLHGMEAKKPNKAKDVKSSKSEPKSKPEKKLAMKEPVDKIFMAFKSRMFSEDDKSLEDVPGKDFKTISESASKTQDFIRELVKFERFALMRDNVDWIIKFANKNPEEFYRRLRCIAIKLYDMCAELENAHRDEIRQDFKVYVKFMFMKIFFGAVIVKNLEAVKQSLKLLEECELTTEKSFQELIDELDGCPRGKITEDAFYKLIEPLSWYFSDLCFFAEGLEAHTF